MGWISLGCKAESRRLMALDGIAYSFGRFVLLCFLLSALSFPLKAQTWSEWFRQKKTQQRYLLEQIAALRVYTDLAQKSYRFARSGLTTISDLSRGELDLHNAFISALKKVNPSISGSTKVAEIIQLQLAIGRGFGHIAGNDGLTYSDQAYINQVRMLVWEECLHDLEELLLVITAGRLEMTDDQRLARLDKVYLSMSEKSAFVQHFQQTVLSHINFKQDGKRSIKNLWELYGLQD